MRVAFLLLVLANLGFAAWHAWFSEEPFVTRPIRPDAPGIRMYAEAAAPRLPPSQPQPDRAAYAQPEREQTLVACISVGPLPNRVEVEEAARMLTEGGFSSTQRTSEGEVWLGHWVYLDAIETQAQGADIVARLIENGIEEAYLIADGDNGNIVSLGVFSVTARAQQRFADAQGLGYSPLMADRFQPGEVYWMDVTASDGADFAISELPSFSVDSALQFEECGPGDNE